MNSDETHSNEYGKGSVSQRTYEQRVQASEKRSIVGAYRQSTLGQAYVDPSVRRSRHEQASSRATKPAGLDQRSRQDMNARRGAPGASPHGGSVPARQAFNEPQSRGYNPYG